MESSIFVSDPIKGVFWPIEVERRIYLTDTVRFCNLILIFNRHILGLITIFGTHAFKSSQGMVHATKFLTFLQGRPVSVQ